MRSRPASVAVAAALLCAGGAPDAGALVCSGQRDATSYRVERGEVLYTALRGVQEKRIAGADAASFRPLAPSQCFAGYAADKNSVYYEGVRIEGADPQSFRPLADNYASHLSWYAADRERWYGEGVPLASRRDGELRLVLPGYAIHPKGAFYGSRRLEREEFEVLGHGGYARSRRHVYYEGEAIPGVDARSFRLYPGSPAYGRDKDHVVVDGKLQRQIDAASFVLLQGAIAKDRNHLYWGIEPMPGVNPATVVWLERGYWKDDKTVFFSKGRIEGAHAASFRVLRSHAIDRHRVYHHEKPLAGIDASSFQEFGFGYARDKAGVYHFGRRLQGADRDSFAVRIDGRGHDKSYGYEYNRRACAWSATAAGGLPPCDPARYGRR
jgi:hypothetical protein